MENYILTADTSLTYDGSVKPRTDIADILSNQLRFDKIEYPMFKKNNNFDSVNISLIKRLTENSILYFQFPTYTSYEQDLDFIERAHRKNITIIAIVHDINSLRGFRETLAEDIAMLNNFDFITLPSLSAERLLKKNGLHVPTVIQRGPFDFLTHSPLNSPQYANIVNYAGNISKAKAGFLATVRNVNLVVYGKRDDFRLQNSAHYAGKYDNDELITRLDSGFGLLWDGDCSAKNPFKDYEKYNWQYKLSLYLAAGIVPIADSASNVGKWLKKTNCGLVINDITDLPEMIKTIDKTAYNTLYQKIRTQQIRVRNGYYIKSIVSDVADLMATNEYLVK
ncbi:hypothetical protein N2F28_09770 [Leuconostoc falkenbergense]